MRGDLIDDMYTRRFALDDEVAVESESNNAEPEDDDRALLRECLPLVDDRANGVLCISDRRAAAARNLAERIRAHLGEEKP